MRLESSAKSKLVKPRSKIGCVFVSENADGTLPVI